MKTLKPIRTDQTFPFAHHTMKTRLPSLLRDLQANNDFPKVIHASLDNLYQQMVTDSKLPNQDYLAPDAEIWMRDYEAHQAETWLNSEWFFAEMLFFREIINRVRYWQTGIDPYIAIKTQELHSDSLQDQLKLALDAQGSPQEMLKSALHFALWGNRIDLSLPEAMAHGLIVNADDLLVDDSELAIQIILNGHGAVHIITDNFGTELAMDLILIKQLIMLNVPVVLHVKMNPTYVSDATSADFHWMLQTLPELSSEFLPLVQTLRTALENGLLRLQPDFFWHSSRFYKDMPPRIRRAFSQARIIISKGDANYRRALCDTIYDVDKPFSALVSDIPTAFLALRTLKSDPIVGITQSKAQILNNHDVNWRTNGKRGLIQLAT